MDVIFWDSEKVYLFGIEEMQNLRASLGDFVSLMRNSSAQNLSVCLTFEYLPSPPPWSHVDFLPP